VILALFSVGVISIMGQVILLRELNVALYGVELIYILAMAVWLLWSAVGAVIGPRFKVPEKSTVGWAFGAFAAIFCLDVSFIRYFRTLAGAFAGTYLPFPVQLAALGVALLPAGLLMGLLFQWSGKILVAQGGRLARAYAIESIGGVVGGGGATLFFFAGIQNLAAAWICAGVAAITWTGLCFSGVRRLTIGATTLSFFTAGFFFIPSMDLATARWNHPDVVATRDSPYGRLTLTRQSDQFALFENDVLSFETQSVEAESLVHLAALSLARIDAAAVLGGGMEGLLFELIRHHPRAIDYVEIDPALIELLRRHLPIDWTAVLDRPSVHVVQDDPRRFLETAGLYDLILIGMPQPDSGAGNRFYTREFFRLSRQHLQPGGILAFRMHAGENVWSPATALRNASVWQALKTEFPHAVALPGAPVIVLASLKPIPSEPEELISRLEKRRIRTRLVSPPYIRYLFTNDRFRETAQILKTAQVVPNTDAHPISYYYSVLIWLSKFFPALIHVRPAEPGGAAVPVFLILAVIVIGWRLRRNRRLHDIFWMAVAGFVGMVLETLVLLYYQAGEGILYQNMGCLIMAFMAGLWAGARIISFLSTDRRRTIRIGAIVFVGIGLVGAVLFGMIITHMRVGLLSSALLLFFTGAAVAGIFVVTGSGAMAQQQRAASEVYAADLAGGCLGAVAGSLWLVPFLGILPTAAAMVGVSLAAVVLIRA
jgi:predicted membrane-bound spermidine synthase